jgi:hypothetical protein
MKKFSTRLMLVVFVILIVSAVYAGSRYRFTCDNQTCGFKEDIDFGGGFYFTRLTGYCVECERFVYIDWRDEEKPKEPIGYVWDEFRGVKRAVHACPKCGKPFLVIERDWDIKHCPKCGGTSFGYGLIMTYD